ncbi:phosphate-starvation-inducible PsiE family protein [Photobacterium rosenbergii]|uniref:phosphate-starvation-inducible PsiE family protein n=1 Tax=Photobacterium rosenbergii TaxID=294936 RepID=UPI001C995DAF|nr:phosphate-starvation-inducible PsiE family protein [Photobacterium rosenbergii]MBY5943684.1 phosphate-starvation-inducible PsiE family protein [Photobacterium rosenbergii]
MKKDPHDELPLDDPNRIIRFSHLAIRLAVKCLAVLMVVVIYFGIADVLYVLYQRLTSDPLYLLDISDIFETFAAFLAVLVAIEIFVNIRIYLKSYEFPLKLVIVTALMAVARKIIVLDFNKIESAEAFSLGAIMFALGLTYGVIVIVDNKRQQSDADSLQ